MSISGYSRYHPIANNDTEENRQLNRRVEIKITRVT
jgi:outer membrane protein OmpA-like peptidoglycan-associated protein